MWTSGCCWEEIVAVVDEYFDLVIIGAGPAGLSAGVYAGRALLKTVVLEKGNVGGRAFTTGEIVNYPAIAQTTGPDLVAKMADHARSFGVEIRQQTVKGVDVSGEEKLVFTRKVAYHAKALIIATGTHAHKLGVPGEEEFVGRGVSYCATCDAEFFKGQDVAIIGCGDQAIEESELISKFAKSVTIVSRREPGNLRCNARSAARAAENEKIRFECCSTIASVNGDDEVESITLKDVRNGEERELACQGVFFFTGADPETEFLRGQVACDEFGWLRAKDDMSLEVRGVFAAGDVREKYLRQVATAVSDGAVAATAADRYITANFKRDKPDELLGLEASS